MSKQKTEKFTVTVTPEKTRPDKPLVELTEDQLKAIAGGGCTAYGCSGNHNETMVSSAELNFEGETDVYTKA